MSEKTDLLLRMLEHSEMYSEAEWEEILANHECHELYNELALLKNATCVKRAKLQATDEQMAAEWKRLEKELTARTQGISHSAKKHVIFSKAAAILLAVLLMSGLVVAAVLLHHPSDSAPKLPPVNPADTSIIQVNTHSDMATEPVLYDNVTLDTILTDLASHYHVDVVYEDESVRRLRLYYQWQPDYTLENVIDMLNHFESFQMRMEDRQLIVGQRKQHRP